MSLEKGQKSVNEYLTLAKKLKSLKDLFAEKTLLLEAHNTYPNNLKILNALLRNIRKTGTKEEIIEVLEEIYSLKKSGMILQELIVYARKDKDTKKEQYLLRERLKIEPDNKRALKELRNISGVEEREVATSSKEKKLLSAISLDYFDLVQRSRELIYTDLSFTSKKQGISSLIAILPEEYELVVLSEFYKHELPKKYAKDLIESYKNDESSPKNDKLCNILLQLVTSNKSQKFIWNNFWLLNRNIEQEPIKILSLK